MEYLSYYIYLCIIAFSFYRYTTPFIIITCVYVYCFLGKLGSVIQDDGNSAGTIASRATVISAKTLRKRRIASIFQHYYPEGGWGYVILLCGFLVQILTHGLQLSFGIFLPIIFHRFRISDPVQIGKQERVINTFNYI